MCKCKCNAFNFEDAQREGQLVHIQLLQVIAVCVSDVCDDVRGAEQMMCSESVYTGTNPRIATRACPADRVYLSAGSQTKQGSGTTSVQCV